MPNADNARSSSSGSCAANATELERANNQIALYTKKIRNEIQRLDSLNAQIAENEAKLLQSPKGGSETNVASIKKQINTMENRLNTALVAFNTKVAANKELRKWVVCVMCWLVHTLKQIYLISSYRNRKIDELRQERVRYDEIYTKLEHEVQANSDEMKRALEDGKKRINMREKALDEIASLQKQLADAKETLRLDKEKLGNLQDHFKEEDEEQNQMQSSNNSVEYNDLPPSAHSQKTDLKESEEYDDEKMLDEAFSEVKALTGIQDADELVQKLTQIEELNFSRFNFTQELEAETDTLEYKIAEAQRELEMLRNSALTLDVRKHQEDLDGCLVVSKLEEQIKHVNLEYQQKLNEWSKVKASIEAACNELKVSLWV